MGFEFRFSKVAIMKLSKSISTSDLLLLCSSGFGEHNNTEHNGERVGYVGTSNIIIKM